MIKRLGSSYVKRFVVAKIRNHHSKGCIATNFKPGSMDIKDLSAQLGLQGFKSSVR